ncbi:two-component system sensor histidine kinase NtrB [Alicyclobacillus herbarius]|uniref:two-component system sensor histidine kinase NtrB n=1 Tax=Alicyclobacillus herbarius TaxID=122960 RepID=UPI000416F306|nr:ATP-binding protein [Alicyclobacillus herbarius]
MDQASVLSQHACVRSDIRTAGDLSGETGSRVCDGHETRVCSAPLLDSQRDKPQLTDSELSNRIHHNLTWLRAARQHFEPVLQRLGHPDITVLVVCPEGYLLDLIGHAEKISSLVESGVAMGTNLFQGPHAHPALTKALETGGICSAKNTDALDGCGRFAVAATVQPRDSKRMAGAFCIQTDTCTLKGPDISVLAQSAVVALTNWWSMEQQRQDLMRMHLGLVSQMEYHLVFLDELGDLMDERHPIPVDPQTRQRMLQMTRNEEGKICELVIGDRTYVADVRTLTDPTGQVRRKLGLFRDVTQSKRWQGQARDLEKMLLLTSMAAGIAHEIRNPLTSARGFLQLITEHLTSEQDRRFINLTLGELDRINMLVKDFMSLARPQDTHFTRVNLNEVLSSLAQFVQPESSLRGVSFETEIGPEPMWVHADANQLKQVLLNIIQNALQACTPRDCVRVRLSAERDEVCIVVQDTGCGMTPKQLERVFQPFFTTKETGTGLGMAISKQIIEEHGGSIHVESAINEGTTVSIRLHRAKPEASSA